MGEKCALCVHFAHIIFFKYTCNLAFLGQNGRLFHKTRPELLKDFLSFLFQVQIYLRFHFQHFLTNSDNFFQKWDKLCQLDYNTKDTLINVIQKITPRICMFSTTHRKKYLIQTFQCRLYVFNALKTNGICKKKLK